MVVPVVLLVVLISIGVGLVIRSNIVRKRNLQEGIVNNGKGTAVVVPVLTDAEPMSESGNAKEEQPPIEVDV